MPFLRRRLLFCQSSSSIIFIFFCSRRHYSFTSKKELLPRRIPSKQKARVIREAQRAVTEYLHATRSLPFTYAEHMAKYSLRSLYSLLSNVILTNTSNSFSTSTFPSSIQRFLRYHPVNEFEFFYESIGIDYNELSRFLHPQKFFISEDSRVFDVACALSGFGFPWNLLGNMYSEEISIFSQDPDDLSTRLHGLKNHGFSSVMIIGICLIFPFVLRRDPKLSGLIDDLRKLFLDFDLANWVEGSVPAWAQVCRKIRIFYDLGCQKGKMGELLGKRKHIFLDYGEDVLMGKADFFSRLGVDKSAVGLFLLERPEIFRFDLESSEIIVSGILNHLGLNQTELESISQKYPYVLGRNKMRNLPEVMRAMNLQEWFFDQMKIGKHLELSSYYVTSSNEDMDVDYKRFLDRIQSSRTPVHTLSKLDFLHGIGFGENSLTLKTLKHLHGTNKELQERFDCLLRAGVHFSGLCRMLRFSPKILNQNLEILEKKVKFFLQNTGSSIEYLDAFPAFLCFDLEKRITPRYRFHMWLIEKGLSAKRYSLASMIATSEKNFIARISGIHPAAAKQWFECFLK